MKRVMKRVAQTDGPIARPMVVPPWANKIRAERTPADLLVSGVGTFFGPIDRDQGSSAIPDLLSTPRGSKRNSVHLQFVEADTEEKQIKFVEAFGPVFASDITNPLPEHPEDKFPGPNDVDTIARQNLKVLAAEQKLFALVFELSRLVVDLHPWAVQVSTEEKEYDAKVMKEMKRYFPSGISSDDTSESAAQGARHFDSFLTRDGSLGSGEKERIQRLRQLLLEIEEQRSTYPRGAVWKHDDSFSWRDQVILRFPLQLLDGRWSTEVYRLANDLLCQIFNLFPSRLYFSGTDVLELPDIKPTGIRSALYFMLRIEYLRKKKLKRCAKCGRYFSGRPNRKFCDPKCKGSEHSQRHRERKKRPVARKARL